MNKTSMKADLHVHSRYSRRPSSWILKKIGCAESYTEPLYLYQTLQRRGMDLITITDHNTISGCLEIAHLADTFISEEVTTYFPEDNCKLHVLVYDISEQQHQEISRVRQNIFELVPWLLEQSIVHAVAHPMYSVNGLLQLSHWERMLLLFTHFELNGARDQLQNTIIRRIIGDLTQEKIEELADRNDLAPVGDRPWEKHLISGSDDHSSLYMGCSHTEVEGADSVESFLEKVEQGRTSVRTHNSTPETLAHNIYSIMYQFYNETFHVSRWIKDPDLIRFLNEVLFPPDRLTGEGGIPVEKPDRSASFDITGSSASNQFLESAKSALFANPDLNQRADNCRDFFANRDEIWLQFVNTLSEEIMRQFADDLLGRLTRADLFYLFTTIGSSASLYMLLAPYFIAYSVFARDRAFAEKCFRRAGGDPADLGCPKRHIAMFTDTYTEINGVAKVIQCQVAAARLTDKDLTLLFCDPESRSETKVADFKPIGTFDLPEYPELKVFYPPILKILAFCYRKQFTHIHAETPGTMGLTALLISNFLNLPFRGTYHTSLPQTVRSLTGDTAMEDMFWKFIVWYYGRMETIYVPSAMTARELIAKGVPEEKIIVHQWGVNTIDFHPDKRNGYLSRNYPVNNSDLKLLYVGRISREKNLQVLASVMRKIRPVRNDVALIVVGEGPYLEEMRAELIDLPVIFTGYLSGASLAQAYASSDIFLFPSTVDTMGNVVVEAQASGVPVIVTDKGGPSENMIDQETGYVVTADDRLDEHMAEAALRLVNDSCLLAGMKKNARAYARDRSFENSFLAFWNNYP